MVNKYRQSVVFLVLIGLIGLLAACGASSYQSYPASISVSEQVIREFENLLNTGEIDEAVELFENEASIRELNPAYSSYDDTGTNLTRQLSWGSEVTYRGKDYIKTYLFNLVKSKFQSRNSSYREAGEGLIWECDVILSDAVLKVEFQAVIAGGKIKALIVNNTLIASS